MWKINTYRRLVCAALLIVCLLLISGCGQGGTEQTAPETTASVSNSESIGQQTTTQVPETTQGLDDAGYASLNSLRQAMVETPQTFAVAYFGYVYDEDPAGPFTSMQTWAPQLCEDLPFLLQIPEERILGGPEGELYCIVPRDTAASVSVNRMVQDEVEEVLYRSGSGDPILLFCNKDLLDPDTQVTIVDDDGTVVTWIPPIHGFTGPENEPTFLFLPSAEESTVPEPVEMVGIWERVYTEVEGYQEASEPGSCVIHITEGAEAYLVSYTDQYFPENNYQDQGLYVAQAELYPGCGNDQWLAEVDYMGPFDTFYSLTLLPDDTLLLQNYFLLDGAPMVSYEYFCRTD